MAGRRFRLPAALACTAVALAVATAGVVPFSAQAGAKEPETPKEWDERVLPYVEFVEDTRGLEFEHPVRVRFLSDEKFVQAIRSDEEPTDEDDALDEQLAGELLALGLVGEQIDLSEAGEDLAADDVVGYYDPEIEELVVRGSNAGSVDARVTIVHELTHALQDQHFDLDALYERADEGSESLALDFLIEGDATTVESAYLETLSPKEEDEYYAIPDDGPSDGPDGALPEGVPYVLEVLSSAPYLLGEAYLYALDPEGGTDGRDRAFARPPTTEEVLIDPVALRQRQRAVKVPPPELEAGEKKAYDPEQFGVLTLYLMLATRLDPRTALEAVTGWGGDRYVGFERAGRACVRVNVTGDTETDTDQLEAALTAWKAAMPAGAVEVGRSDDIVTFTACESDGVTEPTVETFDRVFYNVLAGRIYVVLDVASAGVPLGAARCIGDIVSTDPTAIEIFETAFDEGRDPTDAEFRKIGTIAEAAFSECGSAPAAPDRVG